MGCSLPPLFALSTVQPAKNKFDSFNVLRQGGATTLGNAMDLSSPNIRNADAPDTDTLFIHALHW
jgi:hypothetical protein